MGGNGTRAEPSHAELSYLSHAMLSRAEPKSAEPSYADTTENEWLKLDYEHIDEMFVNVLPIL